MKKQRMVQLLTSLPEEVRDRFRKMAAKINMENPDKVVTAAQIAREMILEHLAELDRREQEKEEENENNET